MSQTGTPTEFLQLGITEPDDTLNVLVDLNGQWRKIDTGVKNVDTKATTNASNITTLQENVQDNTENITNILDTNVNQQNSIDTLQTKVAALEEDDTSYGSRITAVENGVQENSELINDLEVEVSGVKLDMGTVPSGSNLQGEVDGLDTRVTALENSGSVAAVEARVTTLETEVGTVPAGSTVQGQISGLDTDVTTLQGQVNSGNIPFRFSVDGGGNYGYLKADDSFVPFSSGDSHWHELDTTLYKSSDGWDSYSYIVPYKDYDSSDSPNYRKLHDLVHDIDYTLLEGMNNIRIVGNLVFSQQNTTYIAKNGSFTPINGTVVGVNYMSDGTTHYMTRNQNTFTYNVLDINGDITIGPTTHTLRGTPSGPIYFDYDSLRYVYNDVIYYAYFRNDGTVNEQTSPSSTTINLVHFITDNKLVGKCGYKYNGTTTPPTVGDYPQSKSNVVFFGRSSSFILYVGGKYYYYL